MKRIPIFIVTLLVTAPLVMGGGLVTNTNQSAAWARTLTREATLDVDAVYFNPAGTAFFKDGLSLSVSNQSIFQTRTIVSDYPTLSPTPKTYEADLQALLFPSIYAAFKINKLTISAGFNVIGGGGSANFEEGLPSFEIPVSGIVPLLQANLQPLDQAIEGLTGTNPGFANITGYGMDASFTGQSAYYGIQLGVSYAITDMLSVSLGGRYVMAQNTYEGSLANVMIDAPAAYGGTQAPGTYLRTVAMTPGLDPVTVATLNGTADAIDAQTADQNLKSTQSGSGFTPIVGVNLRLSDMVSVAARYEHQTKIELTNDTEVDDVGMFPDGEKTRGDLPGMFALGASVSPINKLRASVGFNYFLDRPAYYGVADGTGEQINNETTIDENAYTLSASLEYKMLGILGLSVGYSLGNLGVNDDYQSDLNYANKTSTIAGGVFVDVGDLLTVNAGYVHVMYDDYEKSYAGPPAYTDTYGKKTGIIAVGVDIKL